MNSWNSRRLRILAAVLLVVGLAGAMVERAQAAVITNVSVTKGPGWVRVNVSAPGASYSVKELPVGSSAYRSLAIDVHGAYIRPGYEPKSRVEVNEGLVAQVRVKSLGNGIVRIYVDVVAFPQYKIAREGGNIVLGIDAYHMKDRPLTPNR